MRAEFAKVLEDSYILFILQNGLFWKHEGFGGRF